MSVKDNLMIGGLVSAGVALIPVYIILLLGVSYLSLTGVNYLVSFFPVLEVERLNIEIPHIIIFSILLSIIFKSSNNVDGSREEWINRNLDLHFEQLHQINEKLDTLQDLKLQNENIEVAVSDIRDQNNA